ncbi:MAG: outer membrane beta-barrel protein [Candidatus Omnitrophica bacterium]|nr:outer membrane beta-barrel protein [Candidatus Omnitrophota bacterium]
MSPNSRDLARHWRFVSGVVLLLLSAFFPGPGYAATSWLLPVIAVQEAFDDNVYLTPNDESEDFITRISPGLVFEPQLPDHEFKAAYLADLSYFADHSSQNTVNHNLGASAKLNFNRWRVELDNELLYFEERAGSEDTARVPRTSNHANAELICVFNKLDLGLKFTQRIEDYRSDNAIGAFGGRALTYQDLDSTENSGELEMGFKFWPKTAMLFGGRYGTLAYDSGNKSDSGYFDVLAGLEGEFLSKGAIEGKIGYRNQNFENDAEDFDSVIYSIALTETFTSRDILEIALDRTTYSTIYQQNTYFTSSRVYGEYTHSLNDRLAVRLGTTYYYNAYPTETTEGTETAERADHLWIAACGLDYELPRWGTVNLEYTYMQKNSNFEAFDYGNNLLSLGLKKSF